MYESPPACFCCFLGIDVFLAPLLIWPERLQASLPLDSIGGPRGPNAQFLKDFGRTLMEKYNPKAIVVFSAHWETQGHIEGMFN